MSFHVKSHRDGTKRVSGPLRASSAKLSDRQIAEYVGVNKSTVSRIRKELESSVALQQIDTRTVTRNGTTYEQDTTNIGNSGARGEPEETEPNKGRALAEKMAKERKKTGKSPDGKAGGRGKQNLMDNCPEGFDQGQARDQVASAAGVSGRSVDRALGQCERPPRNFPKNPISPLGDPSASRDNGRTWKYPATRCPRGLTFFDRRRILTESGDLDPPDRA